ncbi:hypothetical protein SHIRM173S_10925 [Streptomyces hirsutus]
MHRASEPAKPEWPMSSMMIHRLRMNRPATMDGMPVMTSTKKVTAWASSAAPYSTR